MTHTVLTYLLLTAFIVAVVFGLYLNFGHTMHEGGCMYSIGEMTLCATSLAILENWQAAVSTVLVEFFVLCALGAALSIMGSALDPTLSALERYRTRRRIPNAPLLLQELFSDGILHPKVF